MHSEHPKYCSMRQFTHWIISMIIAMCVAWGIHLLAVAAFIGDVLTELEAALSLGLAVIGGSVAAYRLMGSRRGVFVTAAVVVAAAFFGSMLAIAVANADIAAEVGVNYTICFAGISAGLVISALAGWPLVKYHRNIIERHRPFVLAFDLLAGAVGLIGSICLISGPAGTWDSISPAARGLGIVLYLLCCAWLVRSGVLSITSR